MTNKDEFLKILDFTLEKEGGYSNDPDDPGKETKFGISKKFHPKVDIKNLTKEQAASIYYNEYWILSGCDKLSWPINAVVFDTAVNCGVVITKNLLVKAKEGVTDNFEIAKRLIGLRMKRYENLILANSKLKKYIGGWTNRCNELETFIKG